MIEFALFAAICLSKQAPPKDVDVWFCPRIDITSHSPLDDQPGRGGYDARDAFGGTYGSMPHEQGHVVFQDDNGGASQRDFIEWNTKEPVIINRLVVSWQDDAPGNDWRNLAHFWILARGSASEPWKILWQENTPSQVGRYTMVKNIAPEKCQLFRAEFVRNGATNVTAVAPRICSLEAYGHAVGP